MNRDVFTTGLLAFLMASTALCQQPSQFVPYWPTRTGGGGGAACPVQPTQPTSYQPAFEYFNPQQRGISSIDLLTDPASQRTFATPLSTVTIFPPGNCGYPYGRRHSDFANPGFSDAPGDGFAASPGYNGNFSGAYTRDYVGGAGLTVNGRYRGDKWNIGFHLGTGSPVDIVRRSCQPCAPVCNYPLFGWTYPSGSYWGDNISYRSSGYAYGASTYGRDPQLYNYSLPAPTSAPVVPAQATAPLTPPTPLELGKIALAYQQPKVAIEAFKREIKEKGNTPSTLRLLAVALMEDKRFDDAASVMWSAYRIDPKLGGDPIDVSELGYYSAEWRSLVTKAVITANRLNKASSWLLVAALMQAEGRTDLAKKMAEKAKKVGLAPEIAGAFPAK